MLIHVLVIFEHSVVEFASEGRGLRTRHIAHRWNLEPSDSAAYLRGELVEPKKPIVFYIDDTFPLSWNKYIHKGVEVWQKAFEKICFKNAIIAKDFRKMIRTRSGEYQIFLYTLCSRLRWPMRWDLLG